MTNKFERFELEESHDGVNIVFDTTKMAIYVPLCIILLIVGIFLYFNNSMDLRGFIVLIIISISFTIIGLRKSPKSIICKITDDAFIFSNNIQEQYTLPISQIKNIKIKAKPDFSFNIWIIVSFPYKVVLELNDGNDFIPGFNFSFKNNANKFSELLKKIISHKVL